MMERMQTFVPSGLDMITATDPSRSVAIIIIIIIIIIITFIYPRQCL